MPKVSNQNTKTRCETIVDKLKIATTTTTKKSYYVKHLNNVKVIHT